MPVRRPIVAVACACSCAALLIAGCGSTPVATSGSTAASSGSTAASSGSTAATTATTATGTAGRSANAFSPGTVPAVSGATDLAKEPVVAPGRGPAPTKLTGADLVIGKGAVASANDTVKVQYVGAFYPTGKVFDASWTDSGPTSFPLSGVVPGFAEGIIGMRVGGRREIVIPPALGYGAAGQPPAIPGNSTLVFVIDLLGIS